MYHKETPLAIETIDFSTKSLSFKNRLLEGVLSILDIKLPWLNKAYLDIS